MITVLLSKDPYTLKINLSKYQRTATVEAEYGDIVIEGTVITLAHHVRKYKHNPPPCTYKLEKPVNLDAIGISHIDADTVGGVITLINDGDNILPQYMWDVIGYIDINGYHRAYNHPRFNECKIYIHALFKYLEEVNSLYSINTISSIECIDVSNIMRNAIDVLKSIKNNNKVMMLKGYLYEKQMKSLEKKSFVDMAITKRYRRVILRSSNKFVNHLYRHSDIIADILVGYNVESKSITLSFEKDIGISARDYMRRLYGNKAGGHKTIAGTPRDESYDIKDAEELFKKIYNDM
jgi:hypothetical protein